jgi:hypothetical protein
MRFKKTTFIAALEENTTAEVECYQVQAPKWRPLQLCVHKEVKEDSKKWVMSEMTIGLKVSQFAHATRDAAIEDGMNRLQASGYEKVMIAFEARKKTLSEQKTQK